MERETGMGIGMGNTKRTGKTKGRGQQRGTGKKRRDSLRSRSQEMQAGELVTEIQKLGKLEEYEKKKDEKEDEGDDYDHRDPPFLPFKKPKRRKIWFFMCLTIFEFAIIRCNKNLISYQRTWNHYHGGLHMYINHYFEMFNRRINMWMR